MSTATKMAPPPSAAAAAAPPTLAPLTPSTPTTSAGPGAVATPTSPSTATPSSLSRLTLSDKLLLAQAVHHIGTSPPDWARVSSVLLAHPLIKTSQRLEQVVKANTTLGRFFGSRECERAWVALMRQYGLVLDGTSSNVGSAEEDGTATTPRSREARGQAAKTDRASQLTLAEYLYAERISEVRESIRQKEELFRSIVDEIEAIQSGSKDEELEKELGIAPRTSSLPQSNGSDKADLVVLEEVQTPTRSTRNKSSAAEEKDTMAGAAPARLTRRRSSVAAAAQEETSDTSRRRTSRGPVQDVSNSVTEAQRPGEEQQESAATDTAPGKDALSAGAEEKGGEDDQEGPKESGDVEMQDKEELADEAGLEDANEDAGDEDHDEEDGDDQTEKGKRWRSSKRKREEDAASEEASTKKKTRTSIAAAAEEEDEESPSSSKKIGRPRKSAAASPLPESENKEEDLAPPRRSRRGGQPSVPSTPTTPVPPTSASTGGAARGGSNRLGSLRSRETSKTPGAGADADESFEGVDDEGDTSLSTAGNDRVSLSPASARRGGGGGQRGSQAKRGRASSNASSVQGSTGAASGSSRNKRGGAAEERAGSTSADLANKTADQRKREKVLLMLLNEVSNHTHGNLFHTAIKEQDAPDYYTLIRHPIDLKTIKARIKEGQIKNSTQLRRALNRMFANSLIYNRPGTEVHRMALEMRDAAEQMIDRFEQTQMTALSR
ncbi:hypothetical protein FA10DRAFT_280816, partial [Acaromyces ingoldii]